MSVLILSASGQVTVRSTVATEVVVDVVGYYAATANQAGALFESIDNVRLVDTRIAQGPCTPSPCSKLPAYGTTTVQIAGQSGIPATGIVGVAYTLTAVTPSGTGTATAWAADQYQPIAKSLSYTSGVTSSALAITPLSSSGQIKIYSSSASDYLIDVAGYYTQAADGASSMFVPFNLNSGASPRVLDTSTKFGLCQVYPCPKLISGTPLSISLSKNNAVPSSATSAVLSLTVTNPTATGYLSLATGLMANPTNNALSYTSGTTKTGTAVVGLLYDWFSAETHGGNADLAVDIQGYYVVPAWTTKYAYAPDGLLASVTPSTGTATTRYTYDHLGTTGVPQLLNDQTRDYIYAPDGALLETTTDLSKTGIATLFNFSDALNSTRGQFGTSSSASIGTSYSPYGTPSGALTGAAGFAGGITDPGAPTGFTYLLNRYYDPATGVFTTPDPLRDITGQTYAYADNNPTNETDPTGADPLFGGLLGGLLGASASLTHQAYNNWSNGCPLFNNISWGEVAAWGVQGAMIGSGLGALAEAFDSAAATATLLESAGDLGASELDLAAKGVSGTYDEALAGGKHAGFLTNYLGTPTPQIERGIASLEKQIAEHQAKIRNPGAYIDDWPSLDPRQQQALINSKWPGDIARQQEQLDILRGILGSR